MPEPLCLLASYMDLISKFQELNAFSGNMLSICTYIIPSITSFLLCFYPCNPQGNKAKGCLLLSCITCLAWAYIIIQTDGGSGTDGVALFYGGGFILTSFTLFCCTRFCTFYLISLPFAAFLGGPVGLIVMVMLAFLLTVCGILVCAYCWLMALISVLTNLGRPGKVTIISITIKIVLVVVLNILIFIQNITQTTHVDSDDQLTLNGQKPLIIPAHECPKHISPADFCKITGTGHESDQQRALVITSFKSTWFIAPGRSGSYTVKLNDSPITGRRRLNNGDKVGVTTASGSSLGSSTVSIRY